MRTHARSHGELRGIVAAVLCDLPIGASGRDALSRDWYVAIEANPEIRLLALVALAYQTTADLLASDELIAARRIAGPALRCALSMLPDIPEADRLSTLKAAVGLIGQLSQVAARRHHPLGTVVAMSSMIDVWREHGPGIEEVIAVHVDTSLRRLMEVGRLHDAIVLLSKIPPEIESAHSDWTSVQSLIDTFAKDAAGERRTREQMLSELRSDFRRMMRLEDPEAAALAARFVAMLDGDGPFDAAFFEQVSTTMQSLAVRLGDRNAAAPISIEAASLLGAALDAGPAACRAALPRMREIEREFAKDGILDELATTRMAIGRLHAAAGERAEATEWHFSAIETQAKLFADTRLPPLLAGVTETLRPYYSHLIDTLIEEGRHAEALLAAEYCKGTTWRRFRGDRTHDVRTAVHEPIPQPGFVGYFVEDRGIVIFAVRPDGGVAVERMRIPRPMLEGAVGRIRPNGWRPVGMFAPSNGRAIRPLSQFVRILTIGDRDAFERDLTIAPDGILHNVPWHLLEVDGEPLIRRSTVRTVICLDHARHLLTAPAPERRDAIVVTVPAHGEHLEDAWRRWHGRLVSMFAAAEVDTIAAYGEDAGANRLLPELGRTWTHLRTHGHFPRGADASAQNAFRRSGLLLASDGLPKRSVDGLSLTPESLLATTYAGELNGHVSLEACVSGVVRDGAAGDPISLPWTLALLGAKSVIASGWDVDSDHAEDFFDAFYSAIFTGGHGIAEAHRLATLAVLDRHGPAAAAFRLLGS